MLGKHSPQGSLFQMVTLEELVPQDHFLRQLDATVDFSFIRELVRPLYCENNGRPSIDPELALRMFVLSYLYDIPENRLCDEIRMHAGYRWFCRLNFHDEVPNRTTLVKLRRERWGPAGIFDDVMRHVVMECVRAGFVSADVVAVDGTVVKARASTSSLVPIVEPIPLHHYFKKIEEADASESARSENDSTPNDPGSPSSTQDGTLPLKGQKLSNETHRSRTDPDARLYAKGPRDGAELRYFVHRIIDPKSCVILDTVASRCSGTAEREAAVVMCTDLKKRGFNIKHLLGDGGYDGGDFLRQIVDLGITPLVPAQGKLKKLPTWKVFRFDRENVRKRIEKRRSVAALNKTLLMRRTSIYRGTYRLRIRVEHLYGEAKEWHGLRNARGFGIMCMHIQSQMTAAVQNLKRLVRWTRRRPKAPSVVAPVVNQRTVATTVATGSRSSRCVSQANRTRSFFAFRLHQSATWAR